MSQPTTEVALSPELIEYLQGERLLLAISAPGPDQPPYVSTLTWVVARDANTIHLAVDRRSRTLANLKAHGELQVVVFGLEGCFVIGGTARVVAEPLAGVKLPVARLEMNVTALRNAMHFGAKLTQEPAADVTYDPVAAKRLDDTVYAALRR